MPITPFHFGPGAAIHAAAPRHVSFIAFCAANVVMDVEPLYYMLTGQYPLHRFLHTYVGAVGVTATTAVLLFFAVRLLKRLSLPDLDRWLPLSSVSIALGAAAGAFSHIVLDSVMHSDIRPSAPFSESNPLYRALPLAELHWLCIGAGLVGACAIGLRHWVRGRIR